MSFGKNLARFTLSLVVMLALGLPHAPALAGGVSIRPALTEEDVVPGQTITKTLKITNNDSKANTYYIQKKDIRDISAGGVPVFEDGKESGGFALVDWITLGAESVRVGPGETAGVPFTVRVPSSASPGGHFGALFVTLTPIALKTSGSGTGFDVGSILSLRVAGDTVDLAQLYEFRSSRFIYTKPDVSFSATLLNVGNTLLRPIGVINIKDMFGKGVGSLDVNKDQAGVVPGGRREYNNAWSTSSFTFGRYDAVLSVSYGSEKEGKKSLFRSTSFWVLPTNILYPFLGTVLLLTLLAFGFAKLYVRRQLRAVSRGSGHMVRRSPFITIALVAVIFTILFLLGLINFFV